MIEMGRKFEVKIITKNPMSVIDNADWEYTEYIQVKELKEAKG